MMFKTNLMMGLIAALLSMNYFNPESKILFGLVLVIAAIMPDIDIAKSTIGRKLWPFSSIINLIFGHRGLMHTIFPPLILGMITVLLGYDIIGIAFAIGYLTHLLADAVTIQGVMPFFPMTKIRASGPLKTGGMAEYGLLAMALIGLYYLIFVTL